jgi:hypothetical protein
MPDIKDGSEIPMDAASAAREAARRMLEHKYQIRSEFLRVNDLAKLIGIAGTSVRVQISEGRFPIPHRKVGNVIVVKVDDYVEWHCAGAKPGVTRPEAAVEEAIISARPPHVEDEELFEDEPRRPLLPYAEAPKEQAARIKREVLAAMARRRKFK